MYTEAREASSVCGGATVWGGVSEWWNLQPLCNACNSSKGDQLPEAPADA